MSDELSNATRIAALEEQVRMLQKAHAEVACENARLTNDMGIIGNRASMDREEIDSMAKRNDELRADIQDMRSMYEERSEYAERLLSENVRLSNEAATERERCGVLEREVRAWRYHLVQGETVGGDQDGADCRLNGAMADTDRTKALYANEFVSALDAAKFVGGG